MVEHMHIPRKIQYMGVTTHIPSLVMLLQGDKTQDYTISLVPREEVQGNSHSWTKDDSRCRDMPVVCSDLTYARTGIMLKVT